MGRQHLHACMHACLCVQAACHGVLRCVENNGCLKWLATESMLHG